MELKESIIDISSFINERKADGWSDNKIDLAKKDLSNLICNGIIYSCEGFYRVFKQLLPLCFLVVPQSKEAFEEFKENDKAFDALVMNGAFAAELAMKYLYFRSNGYSFKTLKGHNLYELFYSIPECDRILILNKLNVGEKLCAKSVDESIADLQNYFVDFRYSFENITKGQGINVFFKTFVNTICEYALNIKITNDLR